MTFLAALCLLASFELGIPAWTPALAGQTQSTSANKPAATHPSNGATTPQGTTQAPQLETGHGEKLQRNGKGFMLHADVNLVVLHATVLDKKGHMVNDLGQKDFQVFEDGVRQKLSVFSHSDVPVTMGIVIDDSGSMRPKRPSVNAAALTFVKTSNPDDQVFVVNFNDVYYLDTPGNFATSMEDLKLALGKIDSRGGTALYDAVYASLDHLRLGNRDKKVLLVITDGEDNSSHYSFGQLVQYAQKSTAEIYCIGLLGDQNAKGLFKIHSSGDKHAEKILKKLSEATGGKAFFPKTLDQKDDAGSAFAEDDRDNELPNRSNDVASICRRIAHDIRNQYTLAYYPTNVKKDGSFRQVRVVAFLPHSKTRLIVRTRPGYFAPKANEQVASTSNGQ